MGPAQWAQARRAWLHSPSYSRWYLLAFALQFAIISIRWYLLPFAGIRCIRWYSLNYYICCIRWYLLPFAIIFLCFCYVLFFAPADFA
jgi:hypothetical protein